MARSRETKIELTAYDDLFQTDESREEAKLSKIRDIPISEIDEFPDHPFKVLMDEDMEQLVESIKRNGVMTPATVRLKEDGRYELISGHRRKKACELAGLETLKCEVKELTRDEAIIVMVESNLQRSVILPSEKAFAYKMRLEAMKRQAGRPTKENYSPVGNNSEFATSSDELAEKVGESKNQIFRYIRLTELVIGHNPNSPNPYVCWYCKGGSNYFWGYYTNELDAARQKLNERYQSECRMPYNQPAQKQKNGDDRER